MHRCFATSIAPLVAALEPRTIAEVGAGHGRLSGRLLRAPGSAAVHAIDPDPQPGLTALSAREDRLTIHVTTGLAGLAAVPPADLVLLDGDPNWSTVRGELEVAVGGARRAGLPSPVIVVHNVHWPFGRRDGYHRSDAPAGAQRHPSSTEGLLAGRARPSPAGVRLAPFVALHEGGARNGVLTAVEDFLADDAADWELVEVPGFGGVAVLADRSRIAIDARLRGAITVLGSVDVLQRAGRRAEAGRIEAETRAAAFAAERVSLDAARAEARALDHDLGLAVLRAGTLEAEVEAERAARRSAATSHAGEFAALVGERDRLRAEVHVLTESRGTSEAAERRAERLELDLAERERSLAALGAERDKQARLAIEADVRLEHLRTEHQARRQELADGAAAFAELQRGATDTELRLRELGERERLLSGRAVSLEDNLEASMEELSAARSQTAELQRRLAQLRAAEHEAVAIVREARTRTSTGLAAAIRGVFGRRGRDVAADLTCAIELLEQDESSPVIALQAGDLRATSEQPTSR